MTDSNKNDEEFEIAFRDGANPNVKPAGINNGVSAPTGGAPISTPNTPTGTGSSAGQGPFPAPNELSDVVLFDRVLKDAPKTREFMNEIGEKLREKVGEKLRQKIDPPTPQVNSAGGADYAKNTIAQSRQINKQLDNYSANIPADRSNYNPSRDLDRGDGKYTGPVPKNPLDKIVPPGNGQKPKPTEKTSPAKAPIRSKPQRTQTENPDEFSDYDRKHRDQVRKDANRVERNHRNDPVDGFGNPTSASTAPPNWPNGNPSPATNPDIVRPTKLEPNPQKKPGKLVPTVPNTRFDPTKSTPPSNPGGVVRQQPRASQQPANNNNTPGNQPTPSRTTSRRSNTGQPNRPSKVKTKTPSRTNKQRVADKYTNRKYDNLTQAEKDELKKDYTWSPDNGRPTLRRKNKTSNTPELHLNKDGIIQRGPAPTNNRAPSNSRDMAKNFKETYGEDVPKGDNNHHLTSVKTNNETEITQEAQRLGVRGVDDGSNLIASPSNSDAYNGTVKRTPKEQAAVDKLNANGGRVDAVSHPGSHPELDEKAKELLNKESERLKKKYKVEELKQIPEGNLRKELANSIDEVRNQLRKELVDANKLIKKVQNGQLPKSALRNLPKYIKKYPLKDSKGKAPRQGDPKDYYKISEEPASSQKIAQGPTGEQANKFRAVASALKARANGSQMTTYDLGNTPVNLLSKKMDTPDRLAYFMARDITTKMKGTDYMKDEFQVATRGKSGEIQVYNLPSYTLNAVIDPTKQTISVRPQTTNQAARLEGQREMTLAQAQAKPDSSIIKKRGPELGG